MKVIKLLKNILSTAYLSISCLRPMFTIRRDGLNAYLLNDECKYIRLLNMSGTWRGIVQSDVRLTWKWACATMPLVKGCLFTATPTYHPSLSPSSPRSMALCNLNFLLNFSLSTRLNYRCTGCPSKTYPSNVIWYNSGKKRLILVKYFLFYHVSHVRI